MTRCERQVLKSLLFMIVITLGQSLDVQQIEGCPRPGNGSIHAPILETTTKGTTVVQINNVANVSLTAKDSQNIGKLEVHNISNDFYIKTNVKFDYEMIAPFLVYDVICEERENTFQTELIVTVSNVFDNNITFSKQNYIFGAKEKVHVLHQPNLDRRCVMGTESQSVLQMLNLTNIHGAVTLKRKSIYMNLKFCVNYISQKDAVNTEIGIVEIETREKDFQIADIGLKSVPGIRYFFDKGPKSIGIGVSNTSLLDYEKQHSFHFQLRANRSTFVATTEITINIIDIDDSDPKFTQNTYHLEIPENVNTSFVATSSPPVAAFDQDEHINEQIRYKLTGGWPVNNAFIVLENNASVKVNQHLDRELNDTYVLIIEGHQASHNTFRKDVAQLIITLSDVNDNSPKFRESSYDVSIPENLANNTLLLRVTATDADEGDNAAFQYSIDQDKHAFQIDGNTGEVRVLNDLLLDREETGIIDFKVIARETETKERLSGNATVVVHLTDENDNSPIFNKTNYTFGPIYKNISVGSSIGQVSAVDHDIGSTNKEVRYKLSGYGSHRFRINNTTGEIKVLQSLNVHFQRWYNFTVTAEDCAPFKQRRTSSVEVKIHVLDVNMNTPIIQNKNIKVNVSEDAQINAYITEFKASDADIDDKISFSLVPNSHFAIGQQSGVVSLGKDLDREVCSLYNLTVYTSDGVHNDSTALLIYIDDVNDNTPKFYGQKTFSIDEELYPKHVGVVYANDTDSGENSQLKYFIIGDWSEYLDINQSGIITTSKPIDRESLMGSSNKINAVIVAQDGGMPPLSGTATITITVGDVNDNAPVFPQPSVTIYTKEGVSNNLFVANATDKDGQGDNGRILYTITPNTELKIAQNGKISTKGNLTYGNYTFTITANNSNSYFSSTMKDGNQTLHVIVEDINDKKPQFRKQEHSFTVDENTTGKLTNSSSAVRAWDADPTQKFNTVYHKITAGNEDGKFRVDSITGDIYVEHPLDFEKKKFYNLTVTATDNHTVETLSHNTGPIELVNTTVTIHVRDVNDGVPTFTNGTTHCGLFENKIGPFNCSVKATDTDAGINGAIQYSFQNKTQQFEVNSTNGIITCKKALDYEDANQRRFQIKVLAIDSGSPPQTGETLVFIEVMNLNDNKPQLETSFHFNIKENANNTEIGFIHATDDDGDHLDYTLQPNGTKTGHRDFPITLITHSDSNDAVLKTTAAIDREQIEELSFTVIVNDTVHTTQSLVTVHVQDANDNAPQFKKSVYTTEVDENSTEMNLTVQATDLDSTQQNKEIAYVLEDSEWLDFFTIYGNGTIKLQKAFNREALSDKDIPIYLTVTAKDNGSPQLVNFTVVMVTVKDLNDNAPRFTTDSVMLTFDEISRPEDFYNANVTDEDVDEENTRVTYEIVPSQFSDFFRINSSTGLISSTKNLTIPSTKNLTIASTGIMSITIQASNTRPYVGALSNATMKINIKVKDVNNHSPQFHGNFNFSIKENTGTGFLHRTIQAHDSDALPEYSTLTYNISDGNCNDTFYIDSSTADLVLLKPLDYETMQKFAITISASDSQPSYINHKIETSTTLVSIQVEDVNDITPKFSKEKYNCDFKENFIGVIPCNISAYDNEAPPNGGKLLYSLQGVGESVNNLTGEISTVNKIAFESQRNVYKMIIVASDYGSPALKGSASVTIAIIDVNDNSPEFHGKHNFTVNENMPNNTVIGYITVTDKDQDDTLIYNIVNYTETGFDKYKRGSGHFYVRLDESVPGTLILRTTREIDREQTQGVNFNIQVSDGVHVVRHSVSVEVEDLNDNYPRFNSPVYKITITEGEINKTLSVKATDDDATKPNNEISYVIKDSQWSDNFAINNQGMVTLNKAIDREQLLQSQISLTVVANDTGSPSLETSSVIKITVVDVNDNAPVFVEKNATFIFDEDSTPLDFYTVKVIDNDATAENKKVGLEMSNYSNLFTINERTGVFSALNPLAVTTKGYIEITVTAFNVKPYVGLLKNATMKFYIYIKDINNHSPVFNSTYNFSIAENTPPGKLENRKLTAYDEDTTPEFNTITYWVSSGNVNNTFYLERSTAALFLMKPLDYEKHSNYNLTISASDRQPSSDGSGIRNVTTQVLIQVTDVNDNWPHFQKDLYNCKISENKTGDFGCSVQATNDADKPITYSFQNSSPFFSINKSSGEIACSNPVDYEIPQQRMFTIVLLATNQDKAKLTGTTTVKITVINENDNTPKFNGKHQFSVEENQNNTVLGFIKATDEDGDKLHYSLMTADFINDKRNMRKRSIKDFISLSSLASGGVMLTTTSPLDREEVSMINFTIQVNDSMHLAMQTACIEIQDVNDNSPEFDDIGMNITINEEDTNNSFLVQATDQDATEPNNQLSYRIMQPWSDFFAVDDEGNVTQIKPVNREKINVDTIYLVVIATDHGVPPLVNSTVISVIVNDVNDNDPMFDAKNMTFIFDEGSKPQEFYKAHVSDKDATAKNRDIVFEFLTVPSSFANYFTINNVTGALSASKPLDIPPNDYITLSLKVRNVGQKTESAQMNIFIYVKDNNKHFPTFTKDYYFSIPENTPTGILNLGESIQAHDDDKSVHHAAIHYEVTGGNRNNTFYMDSLTADLFLLRHLDFETLKCFDLTISATNQYSTNGTNETATTHVIINITDVNDEVPKFKKDHYACYVKEDFNGTIPSCNIKAVDDENFPNGGNLSYSLQEHENIFHINDGNMALNSSLDYETQNTSYTFVVYATDFGTPQLTGSTTVVVYVVDVNDNYPIFQNLETSFAVDEELPNNTYLGFIEATDKDNNDELSYSLLDTTDFWISEDNGELFTNRIFDYDKADKRFVVKIKVTDAIGHSNNTSMNIIINNVNDNEPKFNQTTYSQNVKENSGKNKMILKVIASDADHLGNLSYSILNGLDMFKIDNTSGDIYVSGELDYENTQHYSLLVEVRDGEMPYLKDLTLVLITVVNVNDNPPEFLSYYYDGAISENNPARSEILQVYAEDVDSLISSLTFNVENYTDIFDFVNNTLATIVSLDSEVKTDYNVNISVSDGNFQDFGIAHVKVIDENDNIPQFIDCADSPCSFNAAIPYSAENHTHLIKINVTDKDVTNTGVTFYLTNADDIFIINNKTGDVYYQSDDRHKLVLNTSYDIQVHVFDHGSPPKSNRMSIHVSIDTSNLNAPMFDKGTYYASLYENATTLQNVITVRATDNDAGLAGTVRYDIEQISPVSTGLFLINASTGEIRLNGSLDFEQIEQYQLIIRARDLADDSRSSSTTVIITIKNVNEVPKFSRVLSTVCTVGNLPSGMTVAIVEVKDEPGKLTFTLLDHNDAFTVVSESDSSLLHRAFFKTKIEIKSTDIGNITLNINVSDIGGLYDSTQLKLQSGKLGNPVFQPSFMSVNVEENKNPTPYVIVDVNTTTENTSNDIVYSLVENGVGTEFNIDSKTGVLTSYIGFPWKRGNTSFTIQVNAENSHGNCSTFVTVHIIDKNDHKPVFIDCCDDPLKIREMNITSHNPSSSCVRNITASDEDEYENLNITIDNYNSLIPFGIRQENNDTSCLIITASIDFDSMSVHAYILELTVSDGRLNSSRNLTIQIEDVNDNYPTFTENPYLINVTEDRSVNSEVSYMSATDVDTMDNNKIRYTLEQSKRSPFTIESVNGGAILKLSSRLDYEECSVYNLTIIATDTANHSTTAPIYVSVLDSNDNKPVFGNQTYEFWQQEGEESLKFRKEIQVSDADQGKNGEVSFEISSGNIGNHFNVTTSNNTATIFIQKRLDRENPLLTKTNGVGVYTLLIVAKDEGDPSLSASATVLVFVTDINDCVPEFGQKKYEYEIIEAAPPDVPVFTVSASDCDLKPHINYTLIGKGKDDFRINQEGQIYPVTSIVYGTPYEVKVCASDGEYNNTTTVIFNVTDVNDHDPEFSHKIYNFSIPENDNEPSEINQVGSVLASDNDTGRNGNVTYRIISTDVLQLFHISEESGMIETAGKLDRDTCANTRYTFTVIAVDHGISQRTGFTEVVVSITDVNDNKPIFSEDEYDGRIHENAEIDTEVIVQPVISATDIDEGINGTAGIVYSLDGDGQSSFRIDRTGRVFVKGMYLDRETRDTYRLQVFAQDENGAGLMGNTTLIIHITDENDQAPVFEKDIYNIEAFENITDSALIGIVTATDQDINGNKTIRYTITNGSTGKFFIDRQQGYIYVNGGLDREKRSNFMLNITASDGINENYTTVNITVLDCNDNYPLFRPPLININITENGAENVTVKNISTTDADEGDNGFVTYFTNDTGSTYIFTVTRNGKIIVLTSLDREQTDNYMFYVYAQDHGNPAHVSMATVQVTVKDVNDNHPLFYDEYDENEQISNKTVSILEKSPVNSPVAWPHVKDRDSGINKEFSFSLYGKGHEYFKIDPKTGIVTIKEKIDRNILMHENISNETTSNTSVISLYINATDKGVPPLSSVLNLSVIIVGINDDAPTFDNPSYGFLLPENATTGSFVGKVQALSNANFTFLKYAIINESNAATVFKINPEKGSITLQTSLDREHRSTYSFAVRVTDGKIPERTAFTVVKVTVSDINDNSPEFKKDSFVFFLEENCQLIPTEFITATDKDAGRNAVLHYSLLNATDSLFTINATTSQLYLNGSLDREETPFVSFTVQATDNGDPPLSSRVRVQIIVQDDNDNSPVFQQSEYISHVLENSQPGTEVLQVSATDADEGLNGTVIYSLGNDSKPFFIEAMSGILRTIGDIDYESQVQYNFIVEASDFGQNSKTSTTNITVIVLDVNDTDTVPRFNKTVYTTSLSPLTQPNVSVLLVDAGPDVLYTITEPNGPFGIEPDTGSITLDEQLNGLRKDYVLLVQAVSIHHPDCLDTAVVVIHVEDQMYASFPVKKYSVSVRENTLLHYELIDLNTTQEDNGQAVVYHLIPVPFDDDFKIDRTTGKISVSGTFDREKTEHYALHVYAVIKETSYSNRSKRSIDDNEASVDRMQRNEAVVTVTIKDVDDNSPWFDLQGRQSLLFYIPKTLEAGDPVVNITAHDPDSLSHVVYRLMNDVGERSSVFYIETRTGEIRTLTRLSQLQSNEYVLNVTATDQVNPSTHVTVKMILIPASSTLIFVVPLTPAEFIQNKEHLLGNMSNILGLNVHLEKVRPHIQGKYVDEKMSDLYLFATDNSTGKVQSKETLTNGITSNIEAIRNLFKCIVSGGACMIITEPLDHTPYSWSGAEIALLVIASIILIATVIGIIILRHIWKQMDEAKQHEVQMFELQSKHSNDSNDPFEILNPTYDETTFEKEIESAAGNIVDIESQERVVIFGPELQLNGADSGVENDSSSSNNDSTEADGSAKVGSSSEQDNPVALGNFPDAESVSSAPSTHRDSVIGSSTHSSIADVRELQLHRLSDQLSTVEMSRSNTDTGVHTSMIIIDMDTGDTDDSEVILDNTASDNEGISISQGIINFNSVTNPMYGESENPDEIVAEGASKSRRKEKDATSEKIETLNFESDIQRGLLAAELPDGSVTVSVNATADASEEQMHEGQEDHDMDTQF